LYVFIAHAAFGTARPVPSPRRSMSERGSSSQSYMNENVDVFMYDMNADVFGAHKQDAPRLGSSVIFASVRALW
jgi:hypothetical protein